jgi:hypothetical protein
LKFYLHEYVRILLVVFVSTVTEYSKLFVFRLFYFNLGRWINIPPSFIKIIECPEIPFVGLVNYIQVLLLWRDTFGGKVGQRWCPVDEGILEGGVEKGTDEV